MKKLIYILLGSCVISVSCPYPERFLNICAQNGIELWDIKRDGGTVRASCGILDCKKLKQLLDSTFKMTVVRKKGFPFLLFRVRKRYVLIAAMILSLSLVWLSSLFIWQIRVTGNETVPTSEILYALKRHGVEVGAFRLSFSSEELSNSILLDIPELSFIAINANGSIADVIVREKIQPPEMRDRNTPHAVYAEKAGIIDKLTVYQGAALKSEGDSVLPGEVIVTGEMEDIAGNLRYVHASAQVYARTWSDFDVKYPLEAAVKSYTGKEKKKTSITVFGNRINLYFDSGISYDIYDKIVTEKPLQIFGVLLPFTVTTVTYKEYELAPAELSDQKIKEECSDFALELIEDGMTGGAVLSFGTEYDAGTKTLSVKAECAEQIGTEREMTPDEIKSQPQEGETLENG